MTIKTFLWIPCCFMAALTLNAQDCNAYFPFQKGALLEFAYYDAKSKLSSTSSQEIQIVDEEANALTAQVAMLLKDKNGKEVTNGNYQVQCKDNVLYMDMSAMMPQVTQAFSTMEIQATGDQLQLPARLQVGQTLPDARMQIKAGSGSVNLMSMTIEITDRKVEAQERITTPAGTFNCYRITYMTNTKMLVSKSFKTVSWFADNIGMVKSESYDKKDKLESSMELTKFRSN
ncbi:MAG TPA: hypothetical protein PKD70_02795 [Saprospiraceae bacterium]|nr:hypothetical protein [Saprospiraceae bacterium]HMP12782.1 hypothetical protein [Saprospiraceae bacterium]